MTPGEMKRLISLHGIKPIKGRSQNFLTDMSVITDIIRSSELKRGETVIEIGPGLGILTDALVEAGANVIAIELDPALSKILSDRFGERIHLVQGDVLSQNIPELLNTYGNSESDYRVIANIPYAITSDIITGFIQQKNRPLSMTLLVQREVAERICAKPNDMNSLAVLVQTYTDPKTIRTVSAGSFLPPPKVDSAVLHMKFHDKLAQEKWFQGFLPQKYFQLVKIAFANKRKKLSNTLRGAFSDDEAMNSCFAKSGINPDSRPEELTIEDWQRLMQVKSDN